MSDESLYFLIYISTATHGFSRERLEELLTASRTHNAAHQITGLLLFRNNCFMQLREGPETAVCELYARIRKDSRHENVITLEEGALRQRDFPDWSMGFRDMLSPEVRQMPGYSDYFDTPLTPEELAGNVSTARHLLLTFKKAFRQP